MQLKNTNVARTTEGTATAEFHGEGNELITVGMAVDRPLTSRTPFSARGMMVQIAALGDDEQSPDVRGEGVSLKETLETEGG